MQCNAKRSLDTERIWRFRNKLWRFSLQSYGYGHVDTHTKRKCTRSFHPSLSIHNSWIVICISMSTVNLRTSAMGVSFFASHAFRAALHVVMMIVFVLVRPLSTQTTTCIFWVRFFYSLEYRYDNSTRTAHVLNRDRIIRVQHDIQVLSTQYEYSTTYCIYEDSI